MSPIANSSGPPRLSGMERLIIEALVEEGEQYGLQLVDASKGRLKRGTVYVTLSRMEDKGLVHSRTEVREKNLPGLPRRLYAPTDAAVRALRALEAAEAVWLDAELQT